jgi:hypothetical protein
VVVSHSLTVLSRDADASSCIRQPIPKGAEFSLLAYCSLLGRLIPSMMLSISCYNLQGGKVIQLRKYDKFVDLGDGRKLICVSWYYSRAEMWTIRCANMSLWPEDCSYMLSTQLQALMWDTMNGKVEQKELEAVMAGKVVDVFAKPCRIIHQNDRSME